MTPSAVGEWTKLLQPTIAKLEVGSVFGDSVVFNRDGAAALGKLLKEMAEKLDALEATKE